MADVEFCALNYDRKIPPVDGNFSIRCSPDTDLWQKAPSTHSQTAPVIYRTVRKGAFASAKIRVSGDWVHKYDQGGLCIIFKSSDRQRWVKTGIEYYQDKPYVSSVATDHFSDWSLRPTLEQSNSATIEIRPYDGALWIYLVGSDGSKMPMREIAWWAAIPDETELLVGPYAAKPAKEKEDLHVHFDEFKIETK